MTPSNPIDPWTSAPQTKVSWVNLRGNSSPLCAQLIPNHILNGVLGDVFQQQYVSVFGHGVKLLVALEDRVILLEAFAHVAV